MVRKKEDPGSEKTILNDWAPVKWRRKKGSKRQMKDFVKEYICQRIKDVWQDPSLIRRDRKNINRIFYTLRPPMQETGWTFEGKLGTRRRKNITHYVKEVCDEIIWIDENGIEHHGISRSDIGIAAADVGYLFFRGHKYSIGLDSYKALRNKGADVTFIEKEDIALSLEPLQRNSGIALLSGRGFSTEYQEELIRLAADNDANVVILSDYEISGLVLARNVLRKSNNNGLGNIVRTGIDEDMLEELGIDDDARKEIEEPYTPSEEHTQHINDHPEDFDEFNVDLDYLKGHRIELDRLIEYVGNERFWEWVVNKIEELFDTRNYWDRGIEKPEYHEFTPEEFDDVYDMVVDKIEDTLQENFDEHEKELSDHEGLIENLDEYEGAWKDECHDIIEESSDLDPLKRDLKRLVKKHSKQTKQK
jgi:methylmalonyl-CoA mutase cobalamin-binding subunit